MPFFKKIKVFFNKYIVKNMLTDGSETLKLTTWIVQRPQKAQRSIEIGIKL